MAVAWTDRPAWVDAAHRLVVGTVARCFRYRVTGLAAEAAFFAILSLPPLVFGLAGTIGFVAERYDVARVDVLKDRVIDLSSQALTPSTVDAVIAPTLEDVLNSGRIDVVSIGFVLALWSGSRALNVFIDTISIMYGLGGQRGIVRTRALSFGLYVVALVIGIVLVPLVLAGPELAAEVVPSRLAVLRRCTGRRSSCCRSASSRRCTTSPSR
ncbi:MAG: YihY/virulence factor BrkB family protein [Aeromicrobium erythreum]